MSSVAVPALSAFEIEDWITVDPETAMTAETSNLAFEFERRGDTLDWEALGAMSRVQAGKLFLKVTAADARLVLSDFADGPDLDLGWNDFVELRIQFPETYDGAIRISFGSTDSPGLSPERTFTIPASLIPNDREFHTYRINVGLIPRWRSTLRDLSIEMVDGVDSTDLRFTIDYIRIGDEPNAPVYETIYSYETPKAGGKTPGTTANGPGEKVYSMESKRFRFLWNDTSMKNPAWTDDMPHGTLRNLEEVWQVFAKLMGYREPAFTAKDKTGSGGAVRGKVNVSTWHSGYWAGFYSTESGEDRARFNATPDGLRVNPPSWVTPHELMHNFQFFNTEDQMPGYWYEGHANYAQERWLQHFQFLYPNTSSFSPDAIRAAHQIMGDSRYQYLSWTPFLYLDTNPDNLPDLGETTSVQIWQKSVSGVHPFMTLDTIAATTGRKDIFGYYARRGATLNYPAQPNIASSISWDPLVTRYQITELEQRADAPNWWRVPYEMAPQQGAYTINQLQVPDHGTPGRTVSVNFRGLPDDERGADWRVAFVIVADDGSERYSELWDSGEHAVTLAADENEVYISVAATPDEFAYVEWDMEVYPYRTHPGYTRFPYEIEVTGATPKQRVNDASAGLVKHDDGGGLKARSAKVAASAFVGPNARVLDNAVVNGNARVEDYAVVQDNAQVLDNAVVSGHAWIMNNAVVRDSGKVRDWGALRERATVSGSGRVFERADVKGGSVVTDTAVVKGTAVNVDGTISGNAIIDGNYWVGRDLSDGFAVGHKPFLGMPDEWITPLPEGLYVAYDFESPHDSRIRDAYGVTDSFTVGSPIWLASDGGREGVLAFDGSSQYVNLDRSVVDVREFSFSAWIKPAGGPANQAVLWVGASPTKYLSFTPNGVGEQAKFSIVNDGSEQVLSGPALPAGRWTHVTVTLSGQAGVLYYNGSKVASESIRIAADQVLAPNTADGGQHSYLARAPGSFMPMFNGTLDDVHFYSSVLTPAQVSALAESSLGATGTKAVADGSSQQLRLSAVEELLAGVACPHCN